MALRLMLLSRCVAGITKQWIFYNRNDEVLSIREAQRGDLWIGTFGGEGGVISSR